MKIASMHFVRLLRIFFENFALWSTLFEDRVENFVCELSVVKHNLLRLWEVPINVTLAETIELSNNSSISL